MTVWLLRGGGERSESLTPFSLSLSMHPFILQILYTVYSYIGDCILLYRRLYYYVVVKVGEREEREKILNCPLSLCTHSIHYILLHRRYICVVDWLLRWGRGRGERRKSLSLQTLHFIHSFNRRYSELVFKVGESEERREEGKGNIHIQCMRKKSQNQI